VIDGAMRLYLIRFLNMPPARLPDEPGDRLDDLPCDGKTLRDALLMRLRLRPTRRVAWLRSPVHDELW
jgi:hypothetical protein